MKEDLRYVGFISYRHCELDKFVAEKLHTLIETYKIPKVVVEKYNITDNNVRRVFRDQEELPLSGSLSDSIYNALKESKFLIVICSPRLKESIWCKREIQNFIKLHGRNNILCVLIEGEPYESFPDELLYYEERIKTKNGKEKIKKISCEPLAMDVRGSTKKEIYSKLKKELIRVIAPMYNLNYDDIKRRHEERILKRKIKVFRTIAIISIIFTIYSALLFLKIFISSNQLKYDQAINLANISRDKLSKDDRFGAIENAYMSITNYKNNKMPITSRGIYELTDSLGVYYTKDNFYAISNLETIGIVESIQVNLDKNYLLSYDNSRELVLWNLNTKKRIKTISDIELSINENKYAFIGNNLFAYQNSNKEVVIIDIDGNEINRINLNYVVNSITSSINGKYLLISTNDKIFIYNTDNYENIAIYENNKVLNTFFDEKEKNVIFEITKDNNIELLTYNLDKKSIINKSNLSSNKIVKMLFKGDNAIILSKEKIKLNSNMLITIYNYKNGKISYQKLYKNEEPLDICMNEKNKTLLVSSFGTSYLLDIYSLKEKAKFSIGNKEIDSYSINNSDYYLLFTSNGDAHVINGVINDLNTIDNDVIYTGLYNFNLTNYEKYLYTPYGIIAYTNNDNRIIIYGNLKNEDIKEIEYKNKSFETIKSIDKKIIIEEYNFKKINFITNMVYSFDKKLLFVSYSDNNLEVYDNEKKRLLNVVSGIKYIDSYIAKTDKNEYIIKGSNKGYVLDKNFELIAYIPKLYDYNNGKLILKSDSKYYEVKLYSLEELKEKANKVLKE